jgi:hypothetical protein
MQMQVHAKGGAPSTLVQKSSSYTRSIDPTRALAAETLKLERALSDLVNQPYTLTPADVDLMWKTASPRMPIPAPAI